MLDKQKGPFYVGINDEYLSIGPCDTLREAFEELIAEEEVTDDICIYIGYLKDVVPTIDAEAFLTDWIDNSDFCENYGDTFDKALKVSQIRDLQTRMNRILSEWSREVKVPGVIEVIKEMTGKEVRDWVGKAEGDF